MSGRTEKNADACYCFWSGASLNVNKHFISKNFHILMYAQKILGEGDLLDRTALASYLSSCQFKFGGIAHAPNETPGQQMPSLESTLIADTYQ